MIGYCLQLWVDHLISSLKLKKYVISGCWDIPLLIFWGRLSLDFAYIGCSPNLKFKSWGRSNKWLLRFSTFNILRSSSLQGIFNFDLFPSAWFWNLRKIQLVVAEIFHFKCFEVVFTWRSSILIWFYQRKFEIWGRSNQGLVRYSTLNIFRLSSIESHINLH